MKLQFIKLAVLQITSKYPLRSTAGELAGWGAEQARCHGHSCGEGGTAAARGAQPHSAWDTELAPDLPLWGS